MGEIRKLDVALSEEMAVAFDSAIATGEYADDADIVGEALALWKRRQADHVAYLKRMWEEGIASGPAIDGNFDLADIKRRGEARLAAMRAAK